MKMRMVWLPPTDTTEPQRTGLDMKNKTPNVAAVHPSYLANALKWSRARDLLAGQDRIKEGGELYLPRMAAHDDKQYEGYLRRALFFNATARTAAGFAGLI